MSNRERVLIVDDERGVRESMRILLKDKYEVMLAVNGLDAVDKMQDFKPAVVLCDLRMPDISGIEVLEKVKAMDSSIEVILVTAYATVDTARKTLLLGAFDYLTKPFNPSELTSIVERALEKRNNELLQSASIEAIQQNYQTLQEEVRNAEHQIATHAIDTIYALLTSLELRDAYSGQHSMAVLWLVDQFSQFLGIPNFERSKLKRAALVHDIGKIGIPEEILNKPNRLTEAERDTMQQHPIFSVQIVSNVNVLKDLGEIVRAHHERWDGNGYPDKLAGEDIPWQAQILAVCDTVHAMSSERCYRSRLPEEAIRKELIAIRGSQLKAEYVDAILDSSLIGEIFRAEILGKMVLTSQQIRQVLDEPAEYALEGAGK